MSSRFRLASAQAITLAIALVAASAATLVFNRQYQSVFIEIPRYEAEFLEPGDFVDVQFSSTTPTARTYTSVSRVQVLRVDDHADGDLVQVAISVTNCEREAILSKWDPVLKNSDPNAICGIWLHRPSQDE